jgi:hypothetical protein
MPFPRIETAFGKSQALAAWAREYGVKYTMLKDRMRLGWSLEEALTRGKRDTRKLRPEDAASPLNHSGKKKFAAYVGEKIGRLTVTAYTPGSKTTKTRATFSCACVCGKTLTCSPYNLLYSASPEPSCGCYCSERMAAMNKARSTQGGKANTPEYHVWSNMVARCTDVTHPAYAHYGARGIGVCSRWLASFQDFLADMGPRPVGKFTLERKDNDLGYSPENCVWADRFAQANNRRNNIRLAARGKIQTLAEWARELGISYNCFRSRILRGVDFEEAVLAGCVRQRKRRARAVPQTDDRSAAR